MVRVSDVVRFPGGSAIVCRSERYQACSTPGCGNHARLLCDFPVKRTADPKRGDARTHKRTGVVWYVWHVEGDDLTISQTEPPSARARRRSAGVMQAITKADWFAKSFATCDRRVCSACAKTVGPDRHYCQAHVRALEQVEITGKVGTGA